MTDDPFRWLEEDTDINVIRWQNAEDQFARTHLANLPTYQEFLAKLQSMGYEAYFYEPAAGGHGYGKDNAERAAFTALGYNFLSRAIGWDV